MRQRILTTIATLLCILTLFSAGVAPAMASVPSSEGSNVSVRAEEVRWYYRVRDGVDEMRLWSLTYGYWKTDWFPVPEGWTVPES